MLKGTRRPASYGKTTRRYLLSESQDDRQQHRPWREYSLDAPESASPNREISRQGTGSPSRRTDIQSSEDDTTIPRLSRPTKKRKLTPPASQDSKERDELNTSKVKYGNDSKRYIKMPTTTQNTAMDDFDVPVSDEEAPQVKRKPASSLVKKTKAEGNSVVSGPKLLPQVAARSSSSQLDRCDAQQIGAQSPNPKLSAVRKAGTKPKQRRPVPELPHANVRSVETNGSRQQLALAASTRMLAPSEARTDLKDSKPNGPLRPARSRRPQTPPRRNDSDDSDDQLCSEASAMPNLASLTPGALNLNDLTVDDLPKRVSTPPSDELVLEGHMRPSTPRRKLKDRLAGTTTPGRPAAGNLEDEDSEPVLTVQSPYSGLRINAADTSVGESHHSHIQAGLGDAIGSRRKVTYGRQRSHLSAAQEDENTAWSVPLDEDPATNSGRRLHMTSFQETTRSQSTAAEASDPEDAVERPLRSVHELIAAGGAARTGNLLDSIFDDIQAASSVSSARGAVFRLAMKLLEPAFPAEFVRNGSLSRLFTLKLAYRDRFIDSGYAIALLQVLPLAPIAEFDGTGHIATLLRHFSSLLDTNNPLLRSGKMKKANMSRLHLVDLAEICRLVTSALHWEDIGAQEIGPALLGLKGFDLCTRRLRQTGYMHQLIDAPTFSLISQKLRKVHNDSFTPAVLSEVRLAISTLESLSIGELFGGDQSQHETPELAISAIAASLPAILISGKLGNGNYSSLFLRLCLNLSTKLVADCHVFAQERVTAAVVLMVRLGFETVEIASIPDERDLAIDNLVLGLGFLTNMTEEYPDCRGLFVSPKDTGKTDIHTLLNIFQARHEGAASAVTESETKANVAFGYLAVLLCSLCLNDQVRRLVASELKDGKLMKLREAMAQFVVFHRSIDMTIDPDEEGPTNPQAMFVERLQQVLSALNTVCTA